MKKVSFKLMVALAGALMMIFSVSCKDDDPEPTPDPGDGKPVLNEDFSFTITGNTVDFSTSLTGNVWFRNETLERDHTVESGAVSVFITAAGTYSFTCNQLVGGATVSSLPFDVVIDQDDLSFLEEGFWKALTGGIDGGKVWRLDDFMSAEGNEYNKFFSTSLKYHQFFEVGSPDNWSNGGHNLYNGDWTSNFNEHTDITPGPEIGTISFNGVDMTAKLVMEDGVDLASNIATSFTTETQVTIVVQPEPYGYKTELETMYGNGITFSDEWATVKFTAPTRMPLDKGRVAVGEYTSTEDGTLYNVKIISCTDSALVVSVDRVYEVDGVESAASLLYNYICDDYEYDYEDPDAFVPPTRPATSGALEDGTYMLADVPGYYFNWITGALGDTWDNVDAYKINMAEWWVLGIPDETIKDGALTEAGQAVWDACYTAYTTESIVVSGSDITINHKMVDTWGTDSTTVVENTIVTTFTQADGVITFADSVSFWTPNANIEKVKEVYILPDVFTTGIGMGVDDINADNKSYNTKIQNWIKQ